MKIPARCNKRNCQARRNLSKPPEQYKRWPKCHKSGCDGSMRVDKCRKDKYPSDNAPVCHEGCLHDFEAKNFPHRYSDKRCRHYEEWLAECTAKASKHNPKISLMDTDEPCPF